MPLCKICNGMKPPNLLRRALGVEDGPASLSENISPLADYSQMREKVIRSSNYSQREIRAEFDDGDVFAAGLEHDEEDEVNIDYETAISEIWAPQELKPYSFGAVTGLFDRQGGCTLCAMIYRRLKAEDLDTDGEYEIAASMYCETKSRRQDRQCLYRLEVIWIPSKPQTFGPYLPQQITLASSEQRRTIMTLQRYTDQSVHINSEGNKAQEDSNFNGRRMDPLHVDFNLLNYWIQVCKNTHGIDCSKSVWSTNTPQRLESLLVIDVKEMCIVKAPQDCRFIALSYCWGRAATLKHVLANSESLRLPGSLQLPRLPATIGDALYVVKAVGERYLWVDALCIIQDDPPSQQVQLAQMGLIYSLAAFTIVAASGDDANSGLPGVRSCSREFQQEKVEIAGETFLTASTSLSDGPLADLVWNTRAWTMQERVLPKKTLIFTSEQVYWRCWGATWLEETCLENVPKIYFQQDPLSKDWLELSPKYVSVERGYYRLYDRLVENYLRRSLGFQSDILNAFSGIMQLLSSIRADTFAWGLPESRFDRCLSWMLRSGGARNKATCPIYVEGRLIRQVPFPSWSWASCFGGVQGQITFTSSIQQLEGDPEIKFYLRDIDGSLRKVHDNTGFVNRAPLQAQEWMNRSGLNELCNRWKGQSHDLSEHATNEPEGSPDTGRLHFWTSTASLHIARIRRNGLDMKDYGYPILWENPFDAASTRVFLETSENIPYQDSTTTKNVPTHLLEQNLTDASETLHDVIFKEFIVIGRSTWTANSDPDRCDSSLSTLVIERNGPIAYRIGYAEIKEKTWASLPNLEWKKVILG